MQKIKYFLRPRYDKNADGLTLVELNLRIDGVEERISLSYYIPLSYWSRKDREMKGGRGLSKSEALKINLDLQEYLDRSDQIVKNARKRNEILTHQSFEKKLFSSANPFNLISFTQDYIKANPLNWVPTTVHSYNGLVTILEEAYGKAIEAGDVPDLREKMERHMYKKGDCLNTRKKRHTQIKSMLKRARKAGHILEDPYTEPIGVVTGHRNFLNMEELNKTIDFYTNEVLPYNLHRTLGQFLFSCFTGCRYSDMVELHQKNIVGDMLEYIAVKTERFNKVVQAPLPEVAKVIIPYSTGRLFDMKTDQTTNRHLKRIFNRIGINKHLTFHCARHTFATLYIYLGGDITNLKEILAHEDIQTTMIYVKMAKRLEAHDQKIFDDNFSKRMKVITTGKAKWMEVA